jgi:hypothetical protein
MSLILSKETNPLGLLVMVGCDHSVLVLEVAGEQEREPSQLQPNKLPAVCEWLFASWSSWFRTQPQLMYARF